MTEGELYRSWRIIGMVALVVADALLEKFGGDHLDETMRNYQGYMERLSQLPAGE